MLLSSVDYQYILFFFRYIINCHARARAPRLSRHTQDLRLEDKKGLCSRQDIRSDICGTIRADEIKWTLVSSLPVRVSLNKGQNCHQ